MGYALRLENERGIYFYFLDGPIDRREARNLKRLLELIHGTHYDRVDIVKI